MLIRFLRNTLLVLVGLVILYGAGRYIHVYMDSQVTGDRAPYLQMLSPHGVTLVWDTEVPEHGVVRYGLAPDRLTNLITQPNVDTHHELRLTGLKSDTRYFYSAGNTVDSYYYGKYYWFVTAPKTGKVRPVRIWVTGDQGQAGKIQTDVFKSMLTWVDLHKRKGLPVLDFWLTTGDNAYRSGSNRQFQDNFFTPYQLMLKNIPVWPAYGNHDDRRWAFFKIFALPTQAESGGVASGTERYYSFDYANVHVIMLDSQSSKIEPGSAMLNWLKQDLAATQQTWIIAVLHHPPFSKGTHDSDNPHDSGGRMQKVRTYILPLLEQNGVDMVLSGHSHVYERSWFMKCYYGDSGDFSAKYIQDQIGGNSQRKRKYRKVADIKAPHSGTIYITLGSSSKLDDGELDHPAMPVSLHKAGSVVLDINDKTLTANFLSNDYAVMDLFSIEKDDKSAPPAYKSCQHKRRPGKLY